MNWRDRKILFSLLEGEGLNSRPGGCTPEESRYYFTMMLGGAGEGFEKRQEFLATTGIRTQDAKAREASALPPALPGLITSPI